MSRPSPGFQLSLVRSLFHDDEVVYCHEDVGQSGSHSLECLVTVNIGGQLAPGGFKGAVVAARLSDAVGWSSRHFGVARSRQSVRLTGRTDGDSLDPRVIDLAWSEMFVWAL